MNRLGFGLIVCVTLAGSAGVNAMAGSPSETGPREAHYRELVAQAKAGTDPVDWTDLRYSAVEQPGYDPDGLDPEHTAMEKAVAAGDWPSALDHATHVIDNNFIDAGAHVVAAAANRALGHTIEEQREIAIASGLFRSIRTGDGLSYAGAFTVIAVREEYDLLRVMHRKLVKQSLNSQGGHMYDVLDTTDLAGQNPQTYYFQFDRAWAAEARLHAPKANAAAQDGEASVGPVPVSAAANPQVVPAVPWISYPANDQMAMEYPERALVKGVAGSVTTDCVFNAEGKGTSCMIIRESPYGYGFGVAAVKLMLKFAVVDRAHFQGAHVTSTMNFKLPAGAPAPSSPAR